MTDLSAMLKTAVGDAYRIERELGGGGMSRVFVAEEVALGRKVVIKVMPPELAASVNADRFRREIQLAAQLQHPAIVPLLTAGSSAELLWYVMPFVPGESLRGRIARQGPLPLDDAVRIWRDLLEALEYAHQHSVVHRDVKPENIMMSGRHAVAMDFGVAKAVSAATGTAALSGMTMAATQTGMAIGTPAYMAPEQAAGDPNIDGRTDLYAAGLVMYEMLAGKGPFEARTPSEMLAAHLAKAPPPLGALRPDAHPALVEMVMQCLEKRPEDRPASVTVLLQALDGLTSQMSGARTPSQTGTAPKRSRARLIVAGVIGVAALAGGGYAFKFRQAMAEAKAMAVGLPDSVRLGVGFVPVASEAADSLIARSVSATMEATLQADRRLYVVGDDRMRNALSDAGIEGNPPPPDSARMLTREYGGHTYLLRSVARAGSGFVLSAEGRAASNDSSLFQVQETAKDASELPGAAKRLAEATRRGLLAVVGRVGRPVPTGIIFGTNPEAARLYTEALAPLASGDNLAAAALLRRALQTDSTFADGWHQLSVALGNFGVNAQEEFTARKNAYRYRDRLRGRNFRLYVEAVYLRTVGDYAAGLVKAQEGLRLADPLARLSFRNTIGLTYEQQGSFDLAARLVEEDYRGQLAQPNSVVTGNYVRSLLDQGRVADVQRVITQLDSAVGAQHRSTLAARMALAYGQRNADTILAIARQRLSEANTDAARLNGLAGYQIGTQMRGQLDSMFAAAAERRLLFAKSRNVGALVAAATQEAIARMELQADRIQATRVLDEALAQVRWDTLPALDRSYGTVIAARLALGDVASARQMVADWERGVPSELAAVQARPIADARGEIALIEKKGAEALAAFRAGASRTCPACTAMNYARAFDVMGRADSTIVWYETVLASSSNRMSQTNARFLARAYKRLGELYEAKGDLKNAIQRYSDFIALWKDADKSLQPAVQDARERVARLQAKRG